MAKKTTKNQDHTLKDLALAYLGHLEKRGTSLMTRATYNSDLALAMGVLGEGTKLSALTPRKIQSFYECDQVTKTRAGKGKAQPTMGVTLALSRERPAC